MQLTHPKVLQSKLGAFRPQICPWALTVPHRCLTVHIKASAQSTVAGICLFLQSDSVVYPRFTQFNEGTNTLLYKNIFLTLYSRKGWCFCGVWDMGEDTYTKRAYLFFPLLLPIAKGCQGLQPFATPCKLVRDDLCLVVCPSLDCDSLHSV